MAEHIVAVFRTNEDASAAARDLQTAGIPASAIRQYASNASGMQPAQPTASTTTAQTSGGFWSWLFGEDSETTRSNYTSDVDAYDRTTAAGNVVLSVTVVDDAKIHQAVTALEAHHPVDIDESDDAEGSELTSATAAHATVGQEFSSTGVAQAGTLNTAPHAASPVANTSTTNAASRTAASDPEEVIPLAEEQLEVGKRTVDRGTTRIRRYVVEKPVEQSVNLRGDKATVERRQPVATSGAPGAFEERVVEVRETAEEPVVSKTPHVAEEVVVGREATERTETVKDTVRSDEVEVTNGAMRKD
jgi:uncharacterized protein (TIGR02271 family)